MKNVRWVLGMVLAGIILAGCNSPAKVCKHLATLDALPMGGEARCEVMWERTRQNDRERFDREASCVLAAKTKADAAKCVK